MTNISDLPIKTAVFHGPSGCGKDTQLDLLEGHFEFVRVAGSSVMKDLLAKDDPSATEASKYGKAGKLYPDKLMYTMLHEWLKDADPDARWIFVSPVRKETQIELFDDLLSKFNRSLDLFIHFTLSPEVAVKRMADRTFCSKCKATYHSKFKPESKKGFCDNDGQKLKKREDDNPESIRRRLSWYQDDIKPILEEYSKRGIVVEVDASGTIESIHEDLLQKLAEYGK